MSPDSHDSLRRPGAILLLSCYEIGRPPLSLASPLALLRRAGFRPAALDLSVEPLRPDLVRTARLVAFAAPMHTALRLGARAAERVRALNPGCRICFYGLYASLNAAYLLDHGADAIIGGEYEDPLVRLAEAADGPGADLPAVPGVRTRRTPEPPWIRRIDLAVPDREGLPPLERYARLEDGGTRRLAGYVEASRGCLHFCRHCPIPPVYGGRFFVVPRDTVLSDIRQQVARGATHITFGDADFLNGPGHTLAIAEEARREFPGLTFDVTAKIEHLLRHRDRLADLRRSGCLFVVSAVESLSDRVLAILDKGHTRADVFEALRLLRGAGLALRPSFVPFTPWSTLADYLDLLGFIQREDLADHVDPVQLSIRLLVPPGSLLAGHPETRPHLGALDAAAFTWRWTHPDPRMDALQAAVARRVEEAAHRSEEAPLTLAAVRALAGETAGLVRMDDAAAPAGAGSAAGRPRPAARDKGRPPRLTEPWFC